MIKREFHIFLASVMFFSRIPVPSSFVWKKEYQNLSLTWLPVVGSLTGAAGALTFLAASCFLQQPIVVMLSLAAMILLTGAFHEDGFADVCDAFGGGTGKEQILTIMKDSRVGAYAVIGLILLLAARIFILTELNPVTIPVLLIATQTLSRWPVLLIAKVWPYARTTKGSKSGETVKSLSFSRITVAFVMSVWPLFLPGSWIIFISIPLVIVVSLAAGAWFNKRIGGYTGDCLGAAQQLNELAFLLLCLILQNRGLFI